MSQNSTVPKCLPIKLEQFRSIDFPKEWPRIYRVLESSQVQETIFNVKQAIVSKQENLQGKIRPKDISGPLLMLSLTVDQEDENFLNEALRQLNSTRESAIEDFARKPNDLLWYICIHQCLEVASLYLEMAKLAYPDGDWQFACTRVDGEIHVTVADFLLRQLFDPFLWMFGYV